jgi:methionine sulfoxide reductase heme-binding subunit
VAAPAKRTHRYRWLKLGVAVAGMTPAAVTAFRFLTGSLGANPIAEAMNDIGLWTLILLLSSLACTPLKIVFDWNWPLRIRKMLGLLAFVYALLHFLIYLVLDQFFDFRTILEDIGKRRFITVGFVAFLILIPLAVTSTNKMVKRLGFARWKQLHRLVYAAGVLGVVHFVWRVKADYREPILYASVLALLLLVRVFAYLRDRRGGGVSPSRP